MIILIFTVDLPIVVFLVQSMPHWQHRIDKRKRLNSAFCINERTLPDLTP